MRPALCTPQALPTFLRSRLALRRRRKASLITRNLARGLPPASPRAAVPQGPDRNYRRLTGAAHARTKIVRLRPVGSGPARPRLRRHGRALPVVPDGSGAEPSIDRCRPSVSRRSGFVDCWRSRRRCVLCFNPLLRGSWSATAIERCIGSVLGPQFDKRSCRERPSH